MSNPTPLSFTKTTASSGRPVDAADLDLGLRPRPRELDGVRDEIDQGEPQHRAIAVQAGQCADLPGDVALRCLAPNLVDGLSRQLVQADERVPRFGASDPGEGEKIVDQIAHLLGRFKEHRHVAAALLVEDRGRVLLQELGIARHVAKRRPQVVRGGISERFQLLVARFQLAAPPLEVGIELPDPLLPALALGDVVVGREDRDRAILLVATERPAGRDDHLRSIRFRLRELALPAPGADQLRVDPLERHREDRLEQLVRGFPDRLFGRPSEQLLRTRDSSRR